MRNKENTYDILSIFGENVCFYRKKRNMNIQELSNKISYDRVCLSRVECGEHNIRYKTALKLAKELNVFFPALFSKISNENSIDRFCYDNFLGIFIDNVRKELRHKRMTQSRIYIESGLNESVVSRVLNGKINNPTLNTLVRIGTSVIDTDIDKLFIRTINVEEEKDI